MFKLFHVGATALIAALIDALKIPELIDKIVPWDEKQCKLSPGQRIKVLLVNILTDRKPLYAIQEFFKDKDIKNLFGPDVEIEDLNDDCLGRVLDKIYDAGPKKVFSTIAFNVIDLEDIELDTLHADTTSWSLYGEYDKYDNRDSEDESGPINITYGYSKDHRPDLKQFIYGLVVNKDKFPVIGESHSGNTDDKTWNNQLISKIDEYLGEELLKEVLYVADSALVTKDNLAKIAGKSNFKFVSRLPGTFALEKELKAKAWEEDNWEYAGKFSEYNNAASYRYQSFIDQIDGNEYRFIVVHSSKLDGRKTRGFNKRLEKERESLKKAADKIAKREFTTKEAALEAWNNFQQNHQSEFYPISLELKEGQRRKKRKKRGRPPKDYVPEYEKIYQLQVHIGPCDKKAVQQAKERLSCFVLITNVLEDDKYSDLDILSEYKKQSSVETSFKFIKNPSFIGPIFLEKNERIEAMSYLILLAYLVYIVLERRVRKGLEKEEEPLVITGGVKTSRPTGIKILQALEPINIAVIEGSSERYLPSNIDLTVPKRILELAGFDLDIYLQVKEEP